MIVILSVIALIATPIILRILSKVRKSAFQDSAYGIMEAAKSYFAETIVDENNPEDKVFSFENGAKTDLSYSGSKPKGGMLILSKNGEIELAIHNNEWCAIKSKTESNVRLIKYEKNKCKISGEVEIPLISVKDSKSETIEKGLDKSILEYFNVVSESATCIDTLDSNREVTNTSNLDIGTHNIECTVIENGKTVRASKIIIVGSPGKGLTEEKMIAEVGENGSIRTDNSGNKRYAGSNPNNWLCFGTQNEICDEEHLYRIIGLIDGKIKLIKNSFYSKMLRWDTTGGSYGSNDWDRPADLKTELNGFSFYDNTNYIDKISKGYIAEATWNIGGVGKSDLNTLENFEEAEKGRVAIGYIGLIGITDFGYASNYESCDREVDLSLFDNACSHGNWLMGMPHTQWTITPFLPVQDSEGIVWCLYPSGVIGNHFAYITYEVNPSLFLKPEVKIIDGIGTKTEPYRLSM